MEYVGKIIYNNVSLKKDDSKNLTVEDLVGHEIVKETEKAVAIEWCEDVAGYHMDGNDFVGNYRRTLKWIPKSVIKTVCGDKMLIPYWVI